MKTFSPEWYEKYTRVNCTGVVMRDGGSLDYVGPDGLCARSYRERGRALWISDNADPMDLIRWIQRVGRQTQGRGAFGGLGAEYKKDRHSIVRAFFRS